MYAHVTGSIKSQIPLRYLVQAISEPTSAMEFDFKLHVLTGKMERQWNVATCVDVSYVSVCRLRVFVMPSLASRRTSSGSVLLSVWTDPFVRCKCRSTLLDHSRWWLHCQSVAPEKYM